MSISYVIKRDGTLQKFDPKKLKQWVKWASGYESEWEDIALTTISRLHDEVRTKDIQKTLIDVCLTYNNEKYYKIASYLCVGNIYKEVGVEIVDNVPNVNFRERFYQLIKNGYWEEFDTYTDEEIDAFAEVIDYSYDLNYEYNTLRRWEEKIARKDRKTNTIVELPQESWMGIAMANAAHSDSEDRIHEVINFYTYIKTREINIPTPMAVHFRTGNNNGASCCTISAADTLGSISAATQMAYTMTSHGAGIGIAYDVRSKGDVVGNHKCYHGGKLPQYRMLRYTIASVSQGSRGGAATVTYTCLDPEIFDLFDAKLPTTPPTKRLNDVDYALAVNDVFLEAVANNDDWMLISKHDAPELYELLYANKFNVPKFREEYNRLLSQVKNSSMNYKIVKARDIFYKAVSVAVETGRLYFAHLTNMNTFTPYKKPIRLSNLCMEIALPTRPYKSSKEFYESFSPESGLTALCFLMAIDVSKVFDASSSVEDFYKRYEKITYTILKALDNNIDSMKYPYKNIEESAQYYRSVGVGVTNLACYLASMGLNYSSLEGRNAVHRLFETHQYYLLKAAARLAKERVRCDAFHDTHYSYGRLPIDEYSHKVDEVHTQPLVHDWEHLRRIINKHGLRMSCVSAHMPCESSSQIGNSCNGVYPIRSNVLYKSNSESTSVFMIPKYDTLKDFYEYAWDIKQEDLYKVYAIISKFTDQSASFDTYINFSNPGYDIVDRDGFVDARKYIQNMLTGFAMGIKTFYYVNSNTGDVGTKRNLEKTVCENCDV